MRNSVTNRLLVGVASCPLVAAVRLPHRVHDPLLARSLVVRDGEAFLLVLTALDLLNLEGGFAGKLRARVAETFGLAAHRVVIHVTHTHSAPPHHRLDPGAMPTTSTSRRGRMWTGTWHPW